MKTLQRRSGVALIEALVALAIMAFGMLGVIGMQATLRFNADASKQRSEAVRLAQEEIERWRDFDVLTIAEGPQAFEAIASTSAATASLPGNVNTTYSRSTTVAALSATDPLLKKVTVTVSWLDRRAASSTDVQTVTLTTVIAGIAPELAGSLGIPGDRSATQRPRERHPAIPVGAVNQGSTSTFTPPGPGSVSWVFSNATGQITQTCNPTTGCTTFNAWLLTGFVHFAVSGPPTDVNAETPSDPFIAGVGVSVIPPPPAPPAPPLAVCATSQSPTFITYYCAVPTSGFIPLWSGRAVLTGLNWSNSLSDHHPLRYKVCRYTPVASHTPPPPAGNAEHPLDYTNVTGSLTNQNFLVTMAGNGTVPYACPGDRANNLLNSNTFAHQPSS